MAHNRPSSLRSTLRLAVHLLLLALVPGTGFAQEQADTDAKADPNYRLSIRDQVEISIFDEPDLKTVQRIDAEGQIRLAYIGTVAIAGKTVREAERFIEDLYVKERILRSPMATVRVLEYAPREIRVLGAVAKPGTIEFPPEMTRMDIIDAISRAGDFTKIARKNRVRITRIGEDGRPRIETVNVEEMISGRKTDVKPVYVYPGDTIFVEEAIF